MKTMLEKRIADKAETRFKSEFKEFCDFLNRNRFANELKIFTEQGGKNYYRLGSSCGYCPSTDILISENLLNNNTNFLEIKQEFLKQFETEETDKIINQLSVLQDYLTNSPSKE